MNKNTKTIIIAVVIVAVLGGLYYGYNRWRQERLVSQYLKAVYGENAGALGGLVGGLNGGTTGMSKELLAELAKQAAKDEADQKKEEIAEAAKTPEDRFDETKAVSLTGSMSSVLKSKIEPQLTAVFGKVKPTLFSNGYMGQENSFLVVYKVPVIPTSDDMNKLVEKFTAAGYVSAMNSIGADSSNLLFTKDNATVSIYYENSENQEVGILYMEQPTE